MPRSQSVHALVHAGFFYRLSKSNTVRECRIVYGALSPQFIRALNTERYLVGKKCFTNETLKGALDVLNKELVVTENLPEPPVQYRRQVALGLFYKVCIFLNVPIGYFETFLYQGFNILPTSEQSMFLMIFLKLST